MEAQGHALPGSAGSSLRPFVPVANFYCMEHLQSGPPRNKLCLDCAAFALHAIEGWTMAEAIIKVRYIAVQPPMAVGASEPMFKGPSFGLTDQPLPEMPFWYNGLPSPALSDPRISPQMEVYGREPVSETPSPRTGSESLLETPSPNTASSDVPELKRCSSCRKWLSKRHYLLVGGKFAATCEHCRATKRPYHVSFATLHLTNTAADNKQKKKGGSTGLHRNTQLCTACQEERPIEDFDTKALHRRKCHRCREEGRPVAPAQDTSPRRPSKVSQMPQEPGKTRCSGCGKAQENRLFFNYKYNPPHKRSTCSPCRQRKQETDRRKRERREAEE
ncbi:unnamed protein product [Clonostachys rhizophaga]|uniref:Uncharacterized protein n=1 Tax=Clonostachys rhizophaga TaxID=160324 RepID=A0A9N9V503_9HYPO|nr:unnamed protein product [Clonostachys rhizophaga]